MMLFFIRKLVESILMPLGFSALLVIVGLVLRRRYLIVAGVVALWLCSIPLASHILLGTLERVYPPRTIAEAPSADAIVVLSGGIVRGISAAGVQWGDSANRYFTGLDLALAGKARFLVLSAGMPPPAHGISQGMILRETSVERGFPADRIIVTRTVLTTEDEASAVSDLPGIHSILLVTSAFHMPRAVMLFRARGLDVSPFPTDQRVLGSIVPESLRLMPEASSLEGAEVALREYYGLAVYHTLFLFHSPGILVPRNP